MTVTNLSKRIKKQVGVSTAVNSCDFGVPVVRSHGFHEEQSVYKYQATAREDDT